MVGQGREEVSARVRATCRNCGTVIDREKVRAEVAKLDIPETAERAAKISVFCGIMCAFDDFGKGAEPDSR